LTTAYKVINRQDTSGQRKIKEETMELIAVLHPDRETGGFWAEVPGLPGCVSQGDTMEESLLNIAEAAQGVVESSTELYLDGEFPEFPESPAKSLDDENASSFDYWHAVLDNFLAIKKDVELKAQAKRVAHVKAYSSHSHSFERLVRNLEACLQETSSSSLNFESVSV